MNYWIYEKLWVIEWKFSTQYLDLLSDTQLIDSKLVSLVYIESSAVLAYLKSSLISILEQLIADLLGKNKSQISYSAIFEIISHRHMIFSEKKNLKCHLVSLC